MNLETLLFGRLTIGNQRINLGRAKFVTLSLRVAEQLRNHRIADDAVFSVEMSRAKLPDATTFNRTALLEQELAAQVHTDLEAESPFPGITMSRVVEVMSSPAYEAYAKVCEPANRMTMTSHEIHQIREFYETKFPDCAPHFPKWVDS